MTRRRSFLAFPDGWPGHGLLLLRLTLALPLIYWGVTDLTSAYHPVIPSFIAAIAAILLVGGLFTSVAGGVVVLAQVWMVVSPAFAREGERSMHLFLAAAAASVAMLGPGAWSLDARRFGRKVFEIGEPPLPRS
jgi:putative oxidoreductase